jgi:hypothetical protein
MECLRTPYIALWHPWPGRCPSAQTLVRLRRCTIVRADAAVSPLGNFKKDATVRPSHGRPRGHRPIVRPSVRPSVRKCPRNNPGQRNDGSETELDTEGAD